MLKHEQRRRQGGDYRIEPVHTAVDVAREYFTQLSTRFFSFHDVVLWY